MKKCIYFCFLPKWIHAADYVIGEMMGQLGNQLFIIAATVALAIDNGATPLFPDLATANRENSPLNREKIYSHLALNLNPPSSPILSRYVEPYFHYAKIPYNPCMSISGYFQSEKYFLHHKETILNLFAPPKYILDELTAKYQVLMQHPNTVAIHYRSYEKEDSDHNVYALCDLEYYYEAIAQFPQNSIFVVFSNQIEWCKQNFKNIPRTFYYIDNQPHYHDLYLMSFCKHQIICNSSFSWWGAYLNRNPDKIVIAPSKWFNPKYIAETEDLIPEEWVKL